MAPRKFSQGSNFQGPENPRFSRKEDRKTYLIFIRYLILILTALFLLDYFYKILLPLTIYPVALLLNTGYHSSVQGITILIDNMPKIELVEACIASSAYFLLLLLNLSIPMKPRTRIFSIIFSAVLFLAINIVRILIFSLLYLNNFKYFDITHLFFWYVVSGVIVFFVWLSTIKTFKIRNIPFVSDIKFFYNQTKQPRKKPSKSG